MALDELRKNIERDARAEAARIDKEGESESQRIIAEATRKAEGIKKKAQEGALADVELRKRDTLIELEMEAGNMLAAAKEDNIERQQRQFVEVVKRRLYKREPEIIKSAVKNFSSVVPLESATIRIDKKNASLVKAPGAKVEHDNIHGVVLVSLDGKVTADATVEGLIESNAETIRGILTGGLFG